MKTLRAVLLRPTRRVDSNLRDVNAGVGCVGQSAVFPQNRFAVAEAASVSEKRAIPGVRVLSLADAARAAVFASTGLVPGTEKLRDLSFRRVALQVLELAVLARLQLDALRGQHGVAVLLTLRSQLSDVCLSTISPTIWNRSIFQTVWQRTSSRHFHVSAIFW